MVRSPSEVIEPVANRPVAPRGPLSARVLADIAAGLGASAGPAAGAAGRQVLLDTPAYQAGVEQLAAGACRAIAGGHHGSALQVVQGAVTVDFHDGATVALVAGAGCTLAPGQSAQVRNVRAEPARLVHVVARVIEDPAADGAAPVERYVAGLLPCGSTAS